MKWIWIALTCIAAIIAVVAVCGAMLPAGHVASRRAKFKQPAEAVWAAIDRPKTFKEDGVDYEVTRSEAPRLLETRIVGKNLPYGGVWIQEISPSPGGCELRITEHGEVYNPIFRFISRFVIGHTATIEKSLAAIANKFGEQIHVED